MNDNLPEYIEFSERISELKNLFLDLWSEYFKEYEPSNGITHKWFNGLGLPSARHLEGMAKHGIDVNWLLTGQGHPRASPDPDPEPDSDLPRNEKEKELVQKTLIVLRARGEGKQFAQALESNINAFHVSVTNLTDPDSRHKPRVGEQKNVSDQEPLRPSDRK